MGKRGSYKKGGFHETCDSKEIISVCTNCPYASCNPDSCERIKNAERKIKERERLKKEVKQIVKKAFAEYKQSFDGGKLLVEKVLEHYRFEIDKLKMIELYFFEGKTITFTCLEVGICRATFFNWMNEVLYVSEKWAKELGVV